MYERFNELGIPVFISRNEDETLTPTNRINRIKPYIKSKDDIVISNHLNAGGGDGAEVIYSLRNNDTLSKMILENIERDGQNIRKWYQRKLPSNLNKDYYFIIRDTEPAESILVEYAFLDSTKDDQKQIKEDWKKWAESVVKAVSEYKGYNYSNIDNNTVNNTYIVQRGDSLWSIAKKFNVGINELKETNNLKSNLINVGQNLIIPGVAPTNQTNVNYVVQKGDTLWSIAKTNNTTIDDIVNLNDLANKTIYIGQIIQIPSKEEKKEVDYNIDNITYVVEKGDTIFSIAKKYNISPSLLVSKNNLIDNIITVGQILSIPFDVESTGNDMDYAFNNIYTVQKGDTLWSISKKYGVSINDIRLINNLTSDVLRIGQIIVIPK